LWLVAFKINFWTQNTANSSFWRCYYLRWGNKKDTTSVVSR